MYVQGERRDVHMGMHMCVLTQGEKKRLREKTARRPVKKEGPR